MSETQMGEASDIIAAHGRSSNHREAIATAERCGCFHCCAEFPPGEVAGWIDPTSNDGQSGTTALCPRCGIDAVIPLYPCMGTDFLRRMQAHWFS